MLRITSGDLAKDLDDFRSVQFRAPMSLAVSKPPVPGRIFVVLLGCSPTKVLEPVVLRIPVEMTALHPGRTRSYKCLQDEPVDLTLIGGAKRDFQITGRVEGNSF